VLYFAGALTVGLGAGVISTLGFAFLTPFLERAIGLGDTCAITTTHRSLCVIPVTHPSPFWAATWHPFSQQ
jgi:hypothetical protein